MYRVALLLASLSAVLAVNIKPREFYERLFFEHMQKFNLHFADGEEFTRRIQIFADMVDTIEQHNADSTQTYKTGLNQFSHLTFEEFKNAVHLGGSRPPNLRRNAGANVHAAPADASTLPASVDWVSGGAVTDVKNQGSCGSCWSFSTTGAIEGAYQLKYGTLKTFSEQELVSCDTTDLGCNGGWMDDAFTWVKTHGGLASESDYPYASSSGTSPSCDTSKYAFDDKLAAPVSFTDVQTGSVLALQSAVAQQPVSIAIQANQIAFQSYKSGVLTGRCGQNLDHGVLLVGYGTLNGVDYWKVKNSWGPTWGIDGYILIERSTKDLCGVLDAPSYPNL